MQAALREVGPSTAAAAAAPAATSAVAFGVALAIGSWSISFASTAGSPTTSTRCTSPRVWIDTLVPLVLILAVLCGFCD